LLIFDPGNSWEGIVKAKRGIGFVLLVYLFPVLALSLAGELLGKAHFGVMQEYGEAAAISDRLLTVYGAVQFLTSLLVISWWRVLVKSMAGTFQPRHTYAAVLKVVAYSFGRFFLCASPTLSGDQPLAEFCRRNHFIQRALYAGIPRVVDPDPPTRSGSI